MANKTKEKEVTLETTLWNCRNAFRGIGSFEKNRDAVISLVFLKFCGDKFNKQREKIKQEHSNSKDIEFFLNDKSFYLDENVFYLEEEARWEYIVNNSSSNEIAVILDNAMAKIEEDNEMLKGALTKNLFASIGAGLGEETDYLARLKKLIDEVNKINEERFQEEDLIGRVYEYFLEQYAASATTNEEGEFYTPVSIVKLIAELIEPYKGIVYDPCCGSGGMFVQSMKFVEKHQGDKKEISIYGQESNEETWRLCKMNLAIRGIQHNLGTVPADTFTNDQHKKLDRKVNYIMANPPFNLKDWWKGKDEDYQKDKRWAGNTKPRRSNGNYAWIMHMISKLTLNGVAGFLLANGALGDDDDAEMRKQIIENDKVEAIIVLPRDMFYTTDISVTLWIISMNKGAGEIHGRKVRDRSGEILFMDLRTWNKNTSKILIDKKSSKNKVVFTDEQITKVKKIYNCWQSPNKEGYQDVPELCQSTKIYTKDLTGEELKNGTTSVEKEGYVLMPSRYIKFIDHDMNIDYEKEMSRIQKEMNEIIKEEMETQDMLEEAFKGIGYGIK